MRGSCLWCLLLPLASASRHIALTGVPSQLSLEFLGADKSNAPAALITLSDDGLLARLQPTSGDVVWRQRVDGARAFHVQADLVLSVTPTEVHLFHAVTGFLQWSRRLPDVRAAYLHGNDTIVLTGDRVLKLSLADGSTAAEIAEAGAVMLFEREESLATYADGRLTIGKQHFKAPSFIIPFPLLNKLVFLAANNVLTVACPTVSTFKTSEPYVGLVQLDGLAAHGYFIGKKRDGKSSILRFKAGRECEIESAWEFSDAPTETIFTGSVDRSGRAYVTRLTFNKYMSMASLSVYSATLNRIQGSTFPFSRKEHGRFVAGTSEVALSEDANKPGNPSIISRSAWVTSTGSVQLWFGGGQEKPEWVREEGLTTVRRITWVDDSATRLPELSPRLREGLIARWARHFRLLSSKALSVDWKALARPSHWLAARARDADGSDWLTTSFGFHKFAILASERDVVYGVEVMKERGDYIKWRTRVFELETFTHRVEWSELHAVEVDGRKLIIGLAQLHRNARDTETLAVKLDAMTGRVMQTAKLFAGAPLATFKVSSLAVAAVDTSHKVHVFSAAGEAFAEFSKPFTYYVQDSPKSVQIHEVDWRQASQPVWRFVLPDSVKETVYSITPLSQGPIASIGKVRADRSTLYKYLDPHMMLITTLDVDRKTSSLQLVNSVSGRTIWSTLVERVDPTEKMSAVLAENWLVFAYVEEGTPGKATRIVSMELYEETTKKRIVPKNSTAYEATAPPTAFSRTFIAPFQIKAMAITQTRLGVSTKALLVTTSQDSVMSIPRRLLDPRRPFTSKLSKQDAEELLIPYDPLIPADPKFTLSRSERVYQTAANGISSTSTLLESTSLVLNYGLDIFAAKVSPSKTFDVLSEDFNKPQLLATILGLTAACVVMRPIVQNRKLRAKWYTAT